jgi:hypothetical protein
MRSDPEFKFSDYRVFVGPKAEREFESSDYLLGRKGNNVITRRCYYRLGNLPGTLSRNQSDILRQSFQSRSHGNDIP